MKTQERGTPFLDAELANPRRALGIIQPGPEGDQQAKRMRKYAAEQGIRWVDCFGLYTRWTPQDLREQLIAQVNIYRATILLAESRDDVKDLIEAIEAKQLTLIITTEDDTENQNVKEETCR